MLSPWVTGMQVLQIKWKHLWQPMVKSCFHHRFSCWLMQWQRLIRLLPEALSCNPSNKEMCKHWLRLVGSNRLGLTA